MDRVAEALNCEASLYSIVDALETYRSDRILQAGARLFQRRPPARVKPLYSFDDLKTLLPNVEFEAEELNIPPLGIRARETWESFSDVLRAKKLQHVTSLRLHKHFFLNMTEFSESIIGDALPNLNKLCLTNNGIDAGLVPFANAVKKGKLTKLTALDIAQNEIGNESFLAFVQVMDQLPNLSA